MDHATAEAWRLLLAGWDSAYEFIHAPFSPEPFRAQRRDDATAVLTASTPDELWETIREDYRRSPVPRGVAP